MQATFSVAQFRVKLNLMEVVPYSRQIGFQKLVRKLSIIWHEFSFSTISTFMTMFFELQHGIWKIKSRLCSALKILFM